MRKILNAYSFNFYNKKYTIHTLFFYASPYERLWSKSDRCVQYIPNGANNSALSFTNVFVGQ